MPGLIRGLEDFPSTARGAKFETAILRDAVAARDLAASCERAILYRPGTPRQSTIVQLRDAFGIDAAYWNESLDEAWNRVGQIRDRFAGMRSLLPRTTIRFHETAPREAAIEPQAWVNRNQPRVINVIPEYFSVPGDDERSRAIKLIHELVHSLNALYPQALDLGAGEDRSHPGMMQGDAYAREKFQQEPLGIPFEKAIRNAYCYQYFTAWLNRISLTRTIRGRRRP